MFLRDVCSSDLLAQPFIIGGVGQTVAIDESVVARAKPGNRRGRPVPPQWVFGGVELGTGNFFMQLVSQRDAATLLPIIQRHIRPGPVSGATSGPLTTALTVWVISIRPLITASSTWTPWRVCTPITSRQDGRRARRVFVVAGVSPDTTCLLFWMNTCGAHSTHGRTLLATFLTPFGVSILCKYLVNINGLIAIWTAELVTTAEWRHV